MGSNHFSGVFRQGPFTNTYTTSGQNPFGNMYFDFTDPFDIFEQFFGGGFARAARRPRYGIKVSFMEAVKGTTKEVTINGKKHTVKIPPGADDGTRLRFADFDITLDVQPHERFKRDGYDLFVDQEVDFVTAILGGKVKVPTIDGDLTLRVRPGTQPNTLIRIRQEGVPRLKSSGKGDLFVRLVVKLPEKINNKQKKLLEEYQKNN
jgi:DnaJ-class molecular chaperone